MTYAHTHDILSSSFMTSDTDPASLRPVAAALVGNGFLTIIKCIVAFITGSAALFAEAIHSVADTSNQALLYIGIRRSRRAPDEDYAYGYANERFFWALLSACGIFFVGAGVTVFHGIETLLHPQPIAFEPIAYLVLALAFVVELYTFWVALRTLAVHMPEASWSERLEEGDPSTLAVLLEDGVAVLGVVIASVSTWITVYTGNTIWDAVGSIIIGISLGIVAIVLIMKNRSYLLGKSIPTEVREEILEYLAHEPAVESVIDFKTEVLDIGVYRIKCEIEFNGSALLKEVYKRTILREQFEEIDGDFEEFKKFCSDYADRIPRLMGRKIDEIEKKIMELHPTVKHIDIEIN